MAAFHPCLVLSLVVALSLSSLDMTLAARHLLQAGSPVPSLPKITLPPLPAMPTIPQAILPPLPTAPTLPKPTLPNPTLPTMPTVPKVTLPTLPATSLPTIPTIPTTIPKIPFFSPPPSD